MLTDIVLAPFSEWNPAEYLASYYTRVEPDEQHTLRFLTRECRKLRQWPTALEFGIGPTLHHLLPLSPHVGEIHVADYLPGNLAAVRQWQTARPEAHDWQAFTRFVLEEECRTEPSQEAIQQREERLKRQITCYRLGDAASADPLGPERRGHYDCVLSCYCADSATADKRTWQRYMANILSLLAPGGFFMTAALRRCRCYRVGERWFPSANVDEEDYERLLRRHGFDMGSVTLEVAHVPEHAVIGYDSVVLASGFLR